MVVSIVVFIAVVVVAYAALVVVAHPSASLNWNSHRVGVVA